MPQSLVVSTPPSNPIKRQRSLEISTNRSRPASSGPSTSTGPPVEDDGSAIQAAVKIPVYLNKSRAKISAAFQDLEWKQRYRLQHAFQNPESSPFRVDRSHTVISRNRYGNVQPWDSARVKLRKPIGGSDYVNASPIKLQSRTPKVRSRSGASTPASTDKAVQSSAHVPEYNYIATQGPKEGQYSHFWHMVMQETPGDVGVIIMLTQLYEGNKEKCAQYYPVDMDNPTIILPAHEDEDEDEKTETTDDGDPFLDSSALSADTDSMGTDSNSDQLEVEASEAIEAQGQCGEVTLLSSTYDAKIGCEVRKLQLTIDDESKEVYHYFFNGWPDFGKPDADGRKALLELTKVSKQVAGDSARIVHCSAGVGRTGTWIGLDFLLQELEAGKLVEPPSKASTPKPTSSKWSGTWGRSGSAKPTTPELKDEDDFIWETVNNLREQRMMMVMNELQYSFLYEVLKEAFIDKYADKETGPIVIDVQEPSPKVARKKSPFGGMFGRGKVKSEEETTSEAGMESEAETEIMEKAELDADSADGVAATADNGDPYSVVAPETIREGQSKDEQTEVRDHEVK